MNTNTAEIIDFAAYLGRKTGPSVADDPLEPPDDGLAALAAMTVPVFFVWPMLWCAVPILDDA